MSELLESSNIIREMTESSIQNRKAIEEAKNIEYENRRVMAETTRETRENKGVKYDNFVTSLKESLVKEALGMIYYNSMDQVRRNSCRGLLESLLDSYIKENGAGAIVSNMKYKTSMLSEMAYVIESTYSRILESIDKDNEESFDVETTDKTEFFDNLKKINDVDDVTNAIRMRVANAEEEFATNNMQDKFDIKGIMNQTADRVEALRRDEFSDDDKEFNDTLEHEAAIDIKRYTEKVNERTKNVLEHMVLSVSENCLKDSGNVFVEANTGKIDIENVIESTTCMYALLETLNTIKLENVDSNYIKNFLENL